MARSLSCAWVLTFVAVSPASAQPFVDEALIVADDAATGAGVAVKPVQTAAEKAAKVDTDREMRDRATWRAAWWKMRGKDGIEERQKPAETLVAYRLWIQNHAELHSTVAAEAGVVVAQLQWKSGDKDGANATLSALWDKDNQGDAGLLVRAEQAHLKLQGALKEDKARAGSEAQGLLEPLLERALEVSQRIAGARFLPGREVLQSYAEALTAQGKGIELGEFALKVMQSAPQHLAGKLQNEGGWLYKATIEALLADARPDAPAQALSWAKLNWVERSFTTGGVTQSSRLVAQSLLAQPRGSELLTGWAKAQKDPTLLNPLLDVALPQADAKALAGLLETLGRQRKDTQVSVLLWMGRHHEAMEAAVAGADRLPQSAKAERLNVMREVARVFKAHDLNIKRANAYLQWAANPVGANPIDAFLAEVPAGAKAQ